MIMLVAASGVALANENDIDDSMISPLPDLETSGVIRANSDAELATVADSGSGTVADPYVIENKRIDATGQGAGIYVRNTTKALIIRNCWVSNAVNLDPNWGPGANIMVYSDGPTVLENNRCDNSSSEGMKLAITNSRISNNIIWGTQNGINLVAATDCTVDNNTITGTSWTGIAVIMTSEFNTISNNTITDCYAGVRLYAQGNRNLVRDNVITGRESGVIAEYGNDNVICNNSISSASMGVEVRYSTGNKIVDNYLVNNTFHTFFRSGSDNLVANNTCLNGATGVYLYDPPSDRNMITGNLFEGCSNFGILIAPSSTGSHKNNTISNNTFLKTHSQGVYIQIGQNNDNKVVNNAFIGCYPGYPQGYDGSSNLWNGSASGNFWYERTSPDNDYDGIVDDPYTIGGAGGNYDNYPMTSTLRIIDPVDMISLDTSSVKLSGTLLNPYHIVSFTWYNYASSQTGSCSGLEEWIASVPLTYGENPITVTMTDTYGYFYSDNVTVISSATTMTMNPQNGSAEYTKESTVDVFLNVTGYYVLDQASVTHYVNGTQYNVWYVPSLTGDPWYEDTWTLDLQEGENRFDIAFRNTNGQTVVGTFTMIKDTTAPWIAILSPGDGDYLATEDVTASWSCTDDTSMVTSIGYSLDLAPMVYTAGYTTVFHDLAEGEHTFALNVTDLLGNSNEKTITFTVDVTKPYLKINDPMDGALFGVHQVMVEYTAYDTLTSLDYLQYRLNAGPWMDVAGLNISLTDLPDGVYSLEMKTADLAGNLNTTSLQFFVDTAAPVVTITSPADGGYSSDRTVTWNVDDVTGAELTEVSTDNATWTPVSGSSHVFSGLLDGTHTVYVRVTDRMGLVGNDSVTFNIDTLAPTVEIISPSLDAYNNTGSVLVKWNAADANGIVKSEISKDGSTWSVVTGTSATVSGLTDGTWTIHVRVTDPAGNTMTDSATVGVSLHGASVELVPNETVYTRDDSLEVTAEISDTAPFISVVLRVHVNGVLVSEVDMTGEVLGDKIASLSSTIALTEGVNVISLTVNDSAGNSVTSEVQVIYDITAPVLDITYPTDGELLNFTVGIAMWTASDNVNGSGLNNTWAKVDNDAWMEIGSAEGWIFSVIGDGEHTLFVKIDDQAGNVAERNVTFLVDTTAPTAEVSPTGNGLGLDSVVVIEFSEQMNTTSVKVVVNGATGIISWNGTVLTFTPSALAYATDYRVNVSGKDLAGNAMGMNWTFRTTAGTGSITGTLVDEDGNRLANVTVQVGDLSAVTNEIGRFAINGLAPGTHLLTVNKDGFEPYSINVTVVAGEADELGELTLVAEAVENDDGGDNTLLIIIAVVAIIAMIGVVAVVLLKKKP
ncbi:MAG: right-handed parallel beta-helix repeat-containing protein [Methanomassiliicoccales archaeon]|nr:right-handed parallel beta-helix repeat-containing protein [Methanomassiliicoccales archaeon]